MREEQSPIYRKIIIPWYDSNPVCVGLMSAMLPVLLFGILGIMVSLETPEYREQGWVAWLLTGFSAWVVVSVGFRIILRLMRQTD